MTFVVWYLCSWVGRRRRNTGSQHGVASLGRSRRGNEMHRYHVGMRRVIVNHRVVCCCRVCYHRWLMLRRWFGGCSGTVTAGVARVMRVMVIHDGRLMLLMQNIRRLLHLGLPLSCSRRMRWRRGVVRRWRVMMMVVLLVMVTQLRCHSRLLLRRVMRMIDGSSGAVWRTVWGRRFHGTVYVYPKGNHNHN